MSKKKIFSILIIALLSIAIIGGIITDIHYSNQIENMLESAEQSEKIEKLNQKWEEAQLERKTDCIFGGIMIFSVFVVVWSIGPEKKKESGITQKEAICFAAELQQTYREQGVYVLPVESEVEEVFITSLDVPKPVEAKFIDNKVVFRWESVQYAEGYSIWRRTGNQRWNRVGRVKSNSCEYLDYNIESNTCYSYTVKAYAFCDGERIISKKDPLGVDVEVIQGNIPEVPNIYKEIDAESNSYMAWNEIPNADEYRILRKLEGGEWETIDILNFNMPCKFYDLNPDAKDVYYTVRAGKKIDNQEILSDYDEEGIRL